jgi:hypothetical protein
MAQVSNAQIAPGAVTTTKIATGAVTSGDIANGAITSTKPAEGYEKRVTLEDDPEGNALGWNPPGSNFVITEDALVSGTSSYISAFVEHVSSPPIVCVVQTIMGEPIPPPPNRFLLGCTTVAVEGDRLHYVLVNLPPHVP